MVKLFVVKNSIRIIIGQWRCADGKDARVRGVFIQVPGDDLRVPDEDARVPVVLLLTLGSDYLPIV